MIRDEWETIWRFFHNFFLLFYNILLQFLIDHVSSTTVSVTPFLLMAHYSIFICTAIFFLLKVGMAWNYGTQLEFFCHVFTQALDLLFKSHQFVKLTTTTTYSRTIVRSFEIRVLCIKKLIGHILQNNSSDSHLKRIWFEKNVLIVPKNRSA